MTIYKKIVNNLKNNFSSAGVSAIACANHLLTSTWSRFDFTMHWSGADGAAHNASFANVNNDRPDNSSVVPTPTLQVYLWHDFAFVPDVGLGGYPLCGVKWSAGTLARTIKENYFKYTDQDSIGNDTQTLVAVRDNIDPGFGAFKILDSDAADAGRSGPRLCFLVASSEIRIYVGGQSPGSIGQRPIVTLPVIARNATFDLATHPFPLQLVIVASTGFWARNIIAGSENRHYTVFSAREQIARFGATQSKLYLRFGQITNNSIIGDGFPLDVETPTIV